MVSVGLLAVVTDSACPVRSGKHFATVVACGVVRVRLCAPEASFAHSARQRPTEVSRTHCLAIDAGCMRFIRLSRHRTCFALQAVVTDRRIPDQKARRAAVRTPAWWAVSARRVVRLLTSAA